MWSTTSPENPRFSITASMPDTTTLPIGSRILQQSSAAPRSLFHDIVTANESTVTFSCLIG